MNKVGVISLGCDKNTVDTERMIWYLREGGFEIVTDPEDADVIVINTCAFIEKARKEAIETILEYAEYKQRNLKKLLVTGCLPERYIDEIFEELTEADGFLGIDNYSEIAGLVTQILSGKRVNAVKRNKEKESGKRVQSTPEHYAYLKIADGCLNRCTFCTIPYIRGAYRSRNLESLVAEAETLARSGTRELILVAQDTTAYGIDIYKRFAITELLRALSGVDGIERIRLMYCYPEKINDELIAEIARNKKICRYLDIPFQHVDDGILKAMGRKYDGSDIKKLLSKLRAEIPGISIRSTFMVGFPGETEEQFESLTDFLKECQIENAGFFEYSREDGTPAAQMPGQIDAKTKRRRFNKISKTNKILILARQSKLRDKTVSVMVDYYDRNLYCFVGRDEGNAPGIDTVIFVESDTPLVPGEIIKTKITGSEGYDLTSRALKEDE